MTRDEGVLAAASSVLRAHVDPNGRAGELASEIQATARRVRRLQQLDRNRDLRSGLA